jgi:hypothetical protein
MSGQAAEASASERLLEGVHAIENRRPKVFEIGNAPSRRRASLFPLRQAPRVREHQRGLRRRATRAPNTSLSAGTPSLGRSRGISDMPREVSFGYKGGDDGLRESGTGTIPRCPNICCVGGYPGSSSQTRSPERNKAWVINCIVWRPRTTWPIGRLWQHIVRAR